MDICKILNDVEAADQLATGYFDQKEVLKSIRRLQTELLRLAQQQINPKRIKLQDGLTPEEAKLARTKDGKLAAIKAVRTRLAGDGLPYGLKEAKDIVENWMQKHLGFMYWPYEEYVKPVKCPTGGNNV